MDIKCPKCGSDHYTEISSFQTLNHFQPVYEKGINVNPDGNIRTIEGECVDCGCRFIARTQYDEVLDITEKRQTI